MYSVGWDADLVIWDSHPLNLGATPTQVIIDGIPQFSTQFAVQKSQSFQVAPKVPNFDKETQETVRQFISNVFVVLLMITF